MSQQKEKNIINNEKQKNSLKLFDCFKHCLKSNKKPKKESISEAELIIKNHKDLLQFNINIINKINNITCNKRNSIIFESPQTNQQLTILSKTRKKKAAS